MKGGALMLLPCSMLNTLLLLYEAPVADTAAAAGPLLSESVIGQYNVGLFDTTCASYAVRDGGAAEEVTDGWDRAEEVGALVANVSALVRAVGAGREVEWREADDVADTAEDELD